MRHTTLTVLALSAAAALWSCKTTTVDPLTDTPKNVEWAEDVEGLPVEGNLVLGKVTRVIDPTTVAINVKDERIIKLVGVKGPDATTERDIRDIALGHLLKHVAQDQPFVYIRPVPGADLNAKEIRGVLMVPERSGKGYLEVHQGMLSLGLLETGDLAEFATNDERDRARERQAEAQRARRGIWARRHAPAKPAPSPAAAADAR